MTNEEELERILISQSDLLQAHQFATFILEENLHDKSTHDAKTKLILLAFNTALIVSYSRPFGTNRGKVTRRRSLSDTVLNSLTDSESRLHQLVLDCRDQEYAHSDLASYDMSIFSSFSGIDIPISRNPFIPLDKTQINNLVSIIEKLVTRTSEIRFSQSPENSS